MSIEAGDGGGDGSRFDAAGCGCTMADDVTLRISWACYCQVYGCPPVPQATLCTPAFKWTSSCGLIVGSSTTAGGLQETVFDGTGAVVGVRRGSDVPEYGCAGDHTGTATALIAGQLPAISCSSARCTCSADGGVSCPPPDAG